MFKRTIQLSRATMNLLSNTRELIYAPEYFEKQHVQSLLTDFHRVKEVDSPREPDGTVVVCDVAGMRPSVQMSATRVIAVGDFGRLEAEGKDRRYTLFSNMGLFYRYALATMERVHNVYSLHASAMYDPARRELLVILGETGAGKSVFLLQGILRGYRVFATELLQFQRKGDETIFLKGSLLDNLRLGTLVYDFPDAMRELGLDLSATEDVWERKVTVDLGQFGTSEDELTNPDLVLLFPHIESGISNAVVQEIADERGLRKMMFDSASAKLGSTILLYESFPVPSFDRPELMANRLQAVEGLLRRENPFTWRAKRILASPRNCMEGIG